MKTEVLVMTIDFGKNHFNAIYLNNQLRLIAPDGVMIILIKPAHAKALEESRSLFTKLNDFFKH